MTDAEKAAWRAGAEAMREAAARLVSQLTAAWPHVGPVPSQVRGEWSLRDKAAPAIRALPLPKPPNA